MTATPARLAARYLVSEARTRQAWGHELLGPTLDRFELSGREAALTTRLAYGTLSAEGTLDEILNRHLDRPGRIHPQVRDVLRVGAYELLFMRTPARVAVHQGVESVRGLQPSASGVVNAVLRKVAAEAPRFPWGDPDEDIEALARATAHPLWLVRTLLNDLGSETARAVVHANNVPAPLYVAHNPFRGSLETLLDRLSSDGADPVACPIHGCIESREPAAAIRSSVIPEGLCLIADAAAQFCASLASSEPGGTTTEIAAGRGTKTMLIQAEYLRAGATGRLIAADAHAFKARLLEERMALLGVPDITTVVADTTTTDSLDVLGGPASADAVMVDAPCSGTGALRRHPEKRWRLNPTDVDRLAEIGLRMLHTAALLVRPGGFVVYSTCTITERENREVVDTFLSGEAGEGFASRSLQARVPAGWEAFVSSEGWFRSLPAPGGPDGHFATVLSRSPEPSD